MKQELLALLSTRFQSTTGVVGIVPTFGPDQSLGILRVVQRSQAR